MSHSMKEQKCPHCGKIFIAAPFHIYKVVESNETTLLCSYTCKLRYTEQIEAQREKENKKRYNKINKK